MQPTSPREIPLQRRLVSVFNWFFSFAFLSSAILQYNDPDPLLWITLYLAAVSVCILHSLAKPILWPAGIIVTLGVVWVLRLSPALLGGVPWRELFDSLAMRSDAVEEAREVGGLLFVLLWMVILIVFERKNPPKGNAK